MNLDVRGCIASGVERVQCRVKGVARGDDGTRIDDATCEKADRLGPQTDRSDHATNPQRLRLDQSQLGGHLRPDVDADIDDA